MVNKIFFFILIAISVSLADFYYNFTPTETGNQQAASTQIAKCSDNLAQLSLQKRNLAKKFGECTEKYSHYSISILFFTVAEGESGQIEEQRCFREYMDTLKTLVTCLKTNHPNTSFYSTDEKNSYLFYWAAKEDDLKALAFNELLSYITHYKEVQESEADFNVLDQFNTYDEELALRHVSAEYIERKLAELNGSREDKDVLRLFFKYLKAKYDYHYRCSIKPAIRCDTSWLGEDKNAFLKKYPESEYRGFVETQMPGFADRTAEEKRQAKEENKLIKQQIREQEIAKKIAERDVWVALTGIAMFGIPSTSTSGFDDNFDVSNAFGIALRASYRRAFFQYQYNFSIGDNNKGGSISEKSYSLMAGAAIGPKKKFTVDILFGIMYVDVYPKSNDMPAAILDDESWTFAVQGNYYFPISDSWDITAFAQARMNFVENYCRDSYWNYDPRGYGYYCNDPNRNDDKAETERFWDGIQWTLSIGVGIRFWKPKPASWY